jgi:hypothetical protein
MRDLAVLSAVMQVLLVQDVSQCSGNDGGRWKPNQSKVLVCSIDWRCLISFWVKDPG